MISRILSAIRTRIQQKQWRASVAAEANKVFPSLSVLDGPFAGMKYPSLTGHGSAVLPKLLGTYEAELHHIIEEAIAADPPLVVDVGCAEGHYAVGMALRLPKTKVIAADCSTYAQELCSQMAIKNGVKERLHVMGIVTKDFLRQQAVVQGGLLICDCEGGEKAILDPEIFAALSSWRILVELHEFIEPGIEDSLIAMANVTHACQVIDSIDDFRREQYWPKSHIAALPRPMRLEFYREGRPGLMRWLVARPK